MAGTKNNVSMTFRRGGVDMAGWKGGVQQWGEADVDGTAAYNAGSTVTTGGTAVSTSEYGVSVYSPSTGAYSNGTAFTQTQTYYIQTNYSNYVYTTTRTCELVTAPTGNGVAGTCVNPANAIDGTDVSTTTTARASTGAGPFYRTQSATGTGGAIFYSGDATFSGSCSSVGTTSVTASGATIQALSISPSSFALQSSARTETITFTYRPGSAYFNSGTTFSGSVNVTVPASLPAFGDANWSGVVNVPASGNPTATAGNGHPVTMLTGGFGTVTSDTSRDVTVQVTIPAGYAGFGTTTNITRTVTQPATVVTSTVTFNIVDSISGATVSSVSPKTGVVGDAFSLYAQANGSTGFAFTAASNATTSITPSGLGAGTPSVNTTFNTWSRLITGSYPATNTTYTITISGACPSTSTAATSGSTFPSAISFTANTGSQSQAMSVTVTPSNGTWQLVKSGASAISVSPTSGTGNATVTVSYSGFGSAAAAISLKSGSTTLDTTNTSAGSGGGGF